MPTNKDPLLTVSEVFEMVPGDDRNAAWINPGFTGVVYSIKSTTNRAGDKPMHICEIRDPSNNCGISMTVWTPTIKFNEGDTIEVFGKGLRRTEYNGLQQATLGKDTEVHVARRGVQAPPPARAPAPATRSAPHDDSRGGGASRPNTSPVVNGQTVGMAVKAAVDLLIHNATAADGPPAPVDFTKLQSQVEQVAALLIAASKRLEAGLIDPGEAVPF